MKIRKKLALPLERSPRTAKARRAATGLLRMDLVILDEIGYPPFSQASGALLFHLLSRLDEHTSVLSTARQRLGQVAHQVA